ncbi:MAG TPA: YciI family protein [Nitrolancea sp.]|nr:YciI family protein [Nitrolancea sp.]
MRFMVFVKATDESEAGVMPTEEMFAAMGRFNEELVKAGVMVDGDGLKPSSYGARVVFDGDKRTVFDGPFAETKELVAGYWIWKCDSLADAIEWAKKCPNPMDGGGVLEIRPYYELEDFGDVITPELKEQNERLRAATSGE